MMDAALFICSHYNVALYHIFGLSGKIIFFFVKKPTYRINQEKPYSSFSWRLYASLHIE